jgi:hypothetical protein
MTERVEFENCATYLLVLFRHFTEWTVETTKYLSQVSRYPDQ